MSKKESQIPNLKEQIAEQIYDFNRDGAIAIGDRHISQWIDISQELKNKYLKLTDQILALLPKVSEDASETLYAFGDAYLQISGSTDDVDKINKDHERLVNETLESLWKKL